MNKKKHALIALFLLLLAVTASAGQITIGDGNHNALMPIHPFYDWSYSQTIYTPGEVNLEGCVIDRLSFYWSGDAAAPNSRDWTVYLGNTSQSVFYEPYLSWIPVSAMTQVFSGSLQIPAQEGWVEFLLDTPFLYTQGSHLVVAIDENSPGNEYHGGHFHGHEGGSHRAKYFHSNMENPDPAAPPTGLTNSKIPNIRLGYSSVADVPNPSQFNASAEDSNSIRLEWVLNPEMDHILIAYNSENIFGNPSGSFNPGDTIEGGGTVLLADSDATSYIHPGLEPNQFLYYRIWSYDGSGYSNGMGSKAATSASPITAFPWEETFEYDSVTQRLWTASEGDLHWQYAGDAGSGGSGISQVANFFSFAENSETTFHLYSPDFVTPQNTDAQLSFDYAYAGRSGKIDKMEIWYSTDRGVSWHLLADLEGGPNGVLNTAGIWNYRFVPTADHWENMSIGLPTGTNKLRFTAISAKGNNLYLDNIRITHSEPEFLEAPQLNITRSTAGFMLSWEEISGADEYHIYRALLPAGEYEYLDSTTSLSYEDTQVQDRAFYKVKAGNNGQ
ncbi:MAG: hypothetical protein GX122_06420 [Candidatus Cloacimonetes bacterium]|nr:hypothetical protein [Candidatus Cloacimonadota bacterium]